MAEISLTGDQMLTVLEMVAKAGPVSAAEVAQLCDMNRTVAHRLLVTLSQRAYIRRSPEGYVVGPAVLKLSRAADTELRAVLRPVITRLAEQTGETVVVHALDEMEAMVIDQAPGQRHLVRVQHMPGSRHPLFQGASGWSLLSFQGDKLIARVMRKAADPDACRERIDLVRRTGYAISHDELQLGVHGVAAPVIERSGRCQISLAILVPGVRSEGLADYADPLLAAAREVSDGLG